ncbi:MAG: aminopeptidase N, partial [Allosphingosinicella sp.]
MLDAQTAPLSPPVAIRREDYQPPEWQVPQIELDFDLDPERTRVRNRLQVERAAGSDAAILRLDGDDLVPESVVVDGADAQWRMEDGDLLIDLSGPSHVVDIVTTVSPRANSRLMGLYESGGILCTQCEAQGFRRITFFPDRPDVLSRFRVRMTADKALFPILLANGDPVGTGDLADGRHWAEWHDPFPKPCYLF